MTPNTYSLLNLHPFTQSFTLAYIPCVSYFEITYYMQNQNVVGAQHQPSQLFAVIG